MGAAAWVGGWVCLMVVWKVHLCPLVAFEYPYQQLGLLLVPLEPGSPRVGNPAPRLERPRSAGSHREHIRQIHAITGNKEEYTLTVGVANVTGGDTGAPQRPHTGQTS